MKKLALILALVVVAATLAFAGTGPEKVDLKASWAVEGGKSAVTFDHWTHQKNNQCTDCHKGTALKNIKGEDLNLKGNIKGMKNDAHEKFCFPCHEEKNTGVGKSCKKCHL